MWTSIVAQLGILHVLSITSTLTKAATRQLQTGQLFSDNINRPSSWHHRRWSMTWVNSIRWICRLNTGLRTTAGGRHRQCWWRHCSTACSSSSCRTITITALWLLLPTDQTSDPLQQHTPCKWQVKVLHPTQYKVGHIGTLKIHANQFLGMVLKKPNQTPKKWTQKQWPKLTHKYTHHV